MVNLISRIKEHQSLPQIDPAAERGATAAAEGGSPEPRKFEFDAFISYRRRDATQLAQWIRNGLQRFRLPPEILSELPQDKQKLHERRPQVWLDTSYEKSSDDFLLKKVFPALDAAARLIVVSTPAAFESMPTKDGGDQDNWLVREIDRFLGEARADAPARPIDVVAGPGVVEGSYPGRLAERSRWDWIDLRNFDNWRLRIFSEALDDGLTKLIAAFYEVPDRFLPLLRREERRRRQRAIMRLALAGFSIAALTTGLAIWGWVQRANAISALQNALVTRAQLSVRLATEELDRKNAPNALSTALAGVETPNVADADRVVLRDSVTAVANAIVNQTFGAVLHGHEDAVTTVSLGPDGRSALSLGADAKAFSWARIEDRPLRAVNSTIMAGNIFAVAEGSGLIASATQNGQVSFWNFSKPEVSPPPFDFGETPKILAFSADGARIAGLGNTGKLLVREVRPDGRIWTAHALAPDGSYLAFDPSGNCLIVGRAAGDLLAWCLESMSPVPILGAAGKVTNGRFGYGGRFLFSTDDGRLWITSAPDWPTPVSIGRHQRSITSIAISSDGRLGATAGMDGTLLIWDLTTGKTLKKIRSADGAGISSTEFDPNGSAVAFAYGNGTIAMWDIGEDDSDAIETLVMQGHVGSILDLSFSPDGDWLASASLDRTVRVWNVRTAQRPRVRKAHSGTFIHAVSRVGHQVLSGGTEDNRVRLWGGSLLEHGKALSVDHPPSALAVTSDGKRAFIGTRNGDVLQWNTTEATSTPFLRENGVISSIAISPDQTTLAAIGIKGDLQVCDLAAPTPDCRTVAQLLGWGYSVAISDDGRWIGATSGI